LLKLEVDFLVTIKTLENNVHCVFNVTYIGEHFVPIPTCYRTASLVRNAKCDRPSDYMLETIDTFVGLMLNIYYC